MRKAFLPKLAMQNIRKNGRFYLPYLITGTITICMFYNILFLSTSESLEHISGASSLMAFMGFGSVVVGLFATVITLYTNSFLMKRRQKELGLYNVLGMGKRHIAGILLCETVITMLITIVCGIAFGILISKLMLLLLFRILSFDVSFGFHIGKAAVIGTIALFVVVYGLGLFGNLVRLVRTKPIDLLYGGKHGEREPKTKWIMTVLGLGCLGSGYYIAVVTESPLKAIFLFFIAVLLVIIGTYFLFIAGSIAILKLLRRNKGYYYKTKHFTSVSGMIYRMKQNAVGLANICILSTMVLVMVSTTVSLYIGAEDALMATYPREFFTELDKDINEISETEIREAIKNSIEEFGLEQSNILDFTDVAVTLTRKGNTLVCENGGADVLAMLFYTLEDYNHMQGTNETLGDGEVLMFSTEEHLPDSFSFANEEWTIKKWLKESPVRSEASEQLLDVYFAVVPDEEALQRINQYQAEEYGDNAKSKLLWCYYFDLSGTKEEKLDCYDRIQEQTNRYFTSTGTPAETEQKGGATHRYVQSRYRFEEEFLISFGLLFFLGIYLGALFLMATGLIIYYKQISEGYDDKDRFEIMNKVGMSNQEIKATINSQVVKIFFLPLAAAVMHLCFAFKLITRLLALFGLTNVSLFAWCTIGTVAAFGLVYFLVYYLTSKAYYRIVRTSR